MQPSCDWDSTDGTRCYIPGDVMERRTFLLTVLAVAACGGTEEAQSQPRTWDARGEVTAIDREAEQITIQHEDIEGLMPEMTMPFHVARPELLDAASVGDDVAFTLTREEGGRFVIQSLRRR